MFVNAMSCIEVVSRTLAGTTIGQIQKAAPWMTRGQVERIMKGMENDGYVWSEVIAYGRTGKRVYRMTEHAAIGFASVARQYTQSCDATSQVVQ